MYVDLETGDNYRPNAPCVILLAHNSQVTYKYMDHMDTVKLYCDIPNGSIVVDPWRNYVNDKCKVIHYGNTRNV